MAITFPRAVEVVPGDPIRAADHNSVALAINARLESGLGDPTQRISVYNVNMARQVRYPDETLFPAVAEFDETYKLIRSGEALWPENGPDEAGGVNTGSILPAFVFGNTSIGLDSEDLRLAEPAAGGVQMTYPGLSVPTAPRDIWELAKLQRGAVDPVTGAIGSPSYSAARKHYALIASRLSPHGNSYGAYFPVPTLTGVCSDGTPDTDPSPNFDIFFTKLSDHSELHFGGTCPEEPTAVAFISYGPEAYLVVQNDGTVTILKRSEWIEGPYSGGNYLRRAYGNHMARVLNRFADSFRGDPGQIADQLAGKKPWNSTGFDVQRFLTTQYLLAPQIGTDLGDEGDGTHLVSPLYPHWEISGTSSVRENTLLPLNGGGTAHSVPDGFAFVAAIVWAQKLARSVSVGVFDGDKHLKTITLDPDADGNAAELFTLPARFNSVVTFRLLEWAYFTEATSAAGIGAEIATLMEYKPQGHDLYLVLRLAGALTTLSAESQDGNGLEEDQSKELGDAYFGNGCILNVHNSPGMSGSLAELNTNAIADTARRISKDTTRLITKNDVVGYAVNADGNSIIWVNRFAFGLSNEVTADIFDGIAPASAPIVSGSIVWGRTYKVSDATVTYNKVNYPADSTFVGVQDVKEFSGAGIVHEAEGIRTDPEPQGTTNEWLFDLYSLQPYNWPDESQWKEDAFANIFWWMDRCTFMHPGTLPSAATWHFSYGQKIWVTPESVTGYRYASFAGPVYLNRRLCFGDNPDDTPADTTCMDERAAFYKSCRIYEPPLSIKSATVEAGPGGGEVVRLELNGRIHHHEDAPATIDRDLSTWNLTDLNAEVAEYRTLENGLREFLIHQFVGPNCKRAGQGDSAQGSDIDEAEDNPLGGCLPRMLLTRKIRRFHESVPPVAGYPLLQDEYAVMEWYLRAICEGNVDGQTTAQYGCDMGIAAVFDYGFQKLCFDAIGKQWLTTLASVAGGELKAGDVRPDVPEGFGFLTNTQTAAEVHNQFVRVINRLTDYRVMLPFHFQTMDRQGDLAVPSDVIESSDESTLAWTTGTAHGYFIGPVPDVAAVDTSGWNDGTIAFSGHVGNISNTDATADPQWQLHVQRTEQRYRWSFTDADAFNAVPESWRDMLDTNIVVLGQIETITQRTGKEIVAAGLGTECSGFADFWPAPGGNVVLFHDPVEADYFTSVIVCEFISGTGIISAEPIHGNQTLRVGRRFFGDGADCFGSVENSRNLTLIPTDAIVLRVPLA